MEDVWKPIIANNKQKDTESGEYVGIKSEGLAAGEKDVVVVFGKCVGGGAKLNVARDHVVQVGGGGCTLRVDLGEEQCKYNDN